MGLFDFLRPIKPVPFNYQPRFYDPKREALRERRKKAEELVGSDPEALKARIHNSFRRQSSYMIDKSYRQRYLLRSNLLLLVIIVVLIALVLVALEIYLPKLEQFLQSTTPGVNG